MGFVHLAVLAECVSPVYPGHAVAICSFLSCLLIVVLCFKAHAHFSTVVGRISWGEAQSQAKLSSGSTGKTDTALSFQSEDHQYRSPALAWALSMHGAEEQDY